MLHRLGVIALTDIDLDRMQQLAVGSQKFWVANGGIGIFAKGHIEQAVAVDSKQAVETCLVQEQQLRCTLYAVAGM